MQLKNGEIYKMREHLADLEKIDVPAKVGYHLGRLIKKLSSVGNDLEASRNKLIIKYGELGANGTASLNQDSPKWVDFVPEYEGLMDEETDIDANKITLPGNTEIAVKLLMVFEPFLEVAE